VRTAIFLAALLIFGFAAAPAYAQPTAVEAALTRAVVDTDLAGGIAVVRDGAGLTRSAAGYSDVDTREGFAPQTHIRAASITKTFVAAAVLQLVAEGKIDLDTSVETYLPGRIRGEDIDPKAITVRQLLRHQSGLPEYFDDDTRRPPSPSPPKSCSTRR
jgi:D-alanyl-D-alanine carboxypeptidase